MGFQYHNHHLFINGQPVVVAGGTGHAISHELCWVQLGTQRVIQPFTNTAKAEDLSHVCTGVTLNGMPLAHQHSYCRVSSGNETSVGGVKTNTIIGRMFFTSGERAVMLEGHPAVCHGARVISNEGNCEPSTWVQPKPCPHPFELKTQSSPEETLTHPAALRIEIRGEGPHPRLFVARHQDTEHQTFAALTSPLTSLRAGHYTVAEIVMTLSHDVMEVIYGSARTRTEQDLTPSLVIQPILFRVTKNHYVYLFKDGFLWREFLSLGERGLFETQFEHQAGADLRISNGRIHQGIGLPVQENSGPHHFQYTTSPTQWSWQTIHRMGGFAPDDERITLDHRLDVSRDETLRTKRLTEILATDTVIIPDDPYTALNTVINYAIADIQRYWDHHDDRDATQALYKQAQADYADKIIDQFEACERAGVWDEDAHMMARVSLALSFSRRGQVYLLQALSNKQHRLHQRDRQSCCIAKRVRDSNV